MYVIKLINPTLTFIGPFPQSHLYSFQTIALALSRRYNCISLSTLYPPSHPHLAHRYVSLLLYPLSTINTRLIHPDLHSRLPDPHTHTKKLISQETIVQFDAVMPKCQWQRGILKGYRFSLNGCRCLKIIVTI